MGPTQALWEMNNCPGTLLWDVLEARAFARAVDDVERAERNEGGDLEESEMTDLVIEIREQWMDAHLAQSRLTGG